MWLPRIINSIFQLLKGGQRRKDLQLLFSAGMCSTDEAPWLVIQHLISFCTAALGCNFPCPCPLCGLALSRTWTERGDGSACALGVCAVWQVK